MATPEMVAGWMQEAAAKMGNAAYVFSQSIAALARINGMIALNEYRKMRGETIAYDEGAFEEVIQDFGLFHNEVINTLNR